MDYVSIRKPVRQHLLNKKEYYRQKINFPTLVHDFCDNYSRSMITGSYIKFCFNCFDNVDNNLVVDSIIIKKRKVL